MNHSVAYCDADIAEKVWFPEQVDAASGAAASFAVAEGMDTDYPQKNALSIVCGDAGAGRGTGYRYHLFAKLVGSEANDGAVIFVNNNNEGAYAPSAWLDDGGIRIAWDDVWVERIDAISFSASDTGQTLFIAQVRHQGWSKWDAANNGFTANLIFRLSVITTAEAGTFQFRINGGANTNIQTNTTVNWEQDRAIEWRWRIRSPLTAGQNYVSDVQARYANTDDAWTDVFTGYTFASATPHNFGNYSEPSATNIGNGIGVRVYENIAIRAGFIGAASTARLDIYEYTICEHGRQDEAGFDPWRMCQTVGVDHTALSVAVRLFPDYWRNGAKCRIVMATDDAFANIVHTSAFAATPADCDDAQAISRLFKVTGLSNPQAYYWMVQVYNSAEDTLIAESYTFNACTLPDENFTGDWYEQTYACVEGGFATLSDSRWAKEVADAISVAPPDRRIVKMNGDGEWGTYYKETSQLGDHYAPVTVKEHLIAAIMGFSDWYLPELNRVAARVVSNPDDWCLGIDNINGLAKDATIGATLAQNWASQNATFGNALAFTDSAATVREVYDSAVGFMDLWFGLGNGFRMMGTVAEDRTEMDAIGMHHSYRVGGTRFICLDTRSVRGGPDTNDEASLGDVACLGASQLAWYEAQIDAAAADASIRLVVVQAQTTVQPKFNFRNDSMYGTAFRKEAWEIMAYASDTLRGDQRWKLVQHDNHTAFCLHRLLARNDGDDGELIYDDPKFLGGFVAAPSHQTRLNTVAARYTTASVGEIIAAWDREYAIAPGTPMVVGTGLRARYGSASVGYHWAGVLDFTTTIEGTLQLASAASGGNGAGAALGLGLGFDE